MQKLTLVLLFIQLNFCGIFGADEFCAKLKIFKKKWLKKDANTLIGLNVIDLKQCLNACCEKSGNNLY